MSPSILHTFFLLALAISCALCIAVPRQASASSEPLLLLEKRLTVSGTHTGQGTFYEVGLGACGKNDEDGELVVAVSHTLFDEYPGHNAENPNANPVCGKKIKATYKNKSVTTKVVDRCTGCAPYDLDFSPAAFKKLASESVGRLSGLKWSFE
ncbi:plant expansin [Cytidiella melzeri]|nr:plant expansin [Cytidiella melzeri]